MAKALANKPKPPSRPVEKPIVVKGGRCYLIKADYKVGPQSAGNVVPAGHYLRELSNGWYRVFKPDGSKHFLSVSPELLEKIEKQYQDE